MLKLAKDFYITSHKKDSGYSNSFLNKESRYTFIYKNYKIELGIEFKIIGYTKEDNIAIVNFGYIVDIEKWSNKEQSYEYIYNLDNDNGKSTKQYLDSQEAREMILKFIERTIKRYIKNISPAIVIRGALSEIKASLPRYKRFDKIFCTMYKKESLDIDKYNSLYKLCGNYKADDNKLIWVYCKKEEHFNQLKDVIR
jgi:hypothetical protein